MAGIYIHIPFCKTKCHYCDFYSVTNKSEQVALVNAICTEIAFYTGGFGNQVIKTIYFGGGTPSFITAEGIAQILATLYDTFQIDKSVEITIEANPDDLNVDLLRTYQQYGINRLSIGVQAFNDKHLHFLNRRHDARQAITCIEDAATIGFNDLSIDLIYGFPGLSHKDWTENLNYLDRLPINHFSAYHLIVEERTPLYNWVKSGKLKLPNDEYSLTQFQQLIKHSAKMGFEHYEISNFAKNQAYSKHNTNYWRFLPYLGLGPSAHSFYDGYRHYNPSNLKLYIQQANRKGFRPKNEFLTAQTRYNEYIMLGLRTKWGVSPNYIQHNFTQFYTDFLSVLKKINTKYYAYDFQNNLVLTNAGIFLSDSIIVDFLAVD